MRGDRVLDLGAREFELLALLVRNRGIVLSRATIMEHVWGAGTPPASPSAVAVLVLRLRRKLEAANEPRVIETVRGWGYALRA
jgi:DNA-binding response OmpR family regulator